MLVAKNTKSAVNAEFNMAINAGAKAFMALSANLYKDGFRSIMRELVSNAVDASNAIGTQEAVIVNIPNDADFDNRFFVQDFGSGMSLETVFEVFSIYFNSSKENDAEQIGGFGLGGKTPFLYTNEFKVETTCPVDGVRRTFVFYLGSNNTPSFNYFDKLDEENSSVKGTKISFAVNSIQDISSFLNVLDELRFIDYPIIVKNNHKEYPVNDCLVDEKKLVETVKAELKEDGMSLQDESYMGKSNHFFTNGISHMSFVYLVLRGIFYEYNVTDSNITQKIAKKIRKIREIRDILDNFAGKFDEKKRFDDTLFFAVEKSGMVELNVSRENIRDTEENKAVIEQLIEEKLEAKYQKSLQKLTETVKSLNPKDFRHMMTAFTLYVKLAVNNHSNNYRSNLEFYDHNLFEQIEQVINNSKEQLSKIYFPKMLKSTHGTVLTESYMAYLVQQGFNYNEFDYQQISKMDIADNGEYSVWDFVTDFCSMAKTKTPYKDFYYDIITKMFLTGIFVNHDTKDTHLKGIIKAYRDRQLPKSPYPFVLFLDNQSDIDVKFAQYQKPVTDKKEKVVINAVDWDSMIPQYGDNVYLWQDKSFAQVTKKLTARNIVIPSSFNLYAQKTGGKYVKEYEANIVKMFFREQQLTLIGHCNHSNLELVVVSDDVYRQLVDSNAVKPSLIEQVSSKAVSALYFYLKKIKARIESGIAIEELCQKMSFPHFGDYQANRYDLNMKLFEKSNIDLARKMEINKFIDLIDTKMAHLLDEDVKKSDVFFNDLAFLTNIIMYCLSDKHFTKKNEIPKSNYDHSYYKLLQECSVVTGINAENLKKIFSNMKIKYSHMVNIVNTCEIHAYVDKFVRSNYSTQYPLLNPYASFILTEMQ